MKTMGFVISSKENEKRRALIPMDLEGIKNGKYLYFEKKYGEVLGYSDEEYRKKGVHIVGRENAYNQDIVCCVKSPEPKERKYFRKKGQTLFGWIHAVQGRAITDFLLEKRMIAIAWEEMFERGRHVFCKNNELAGDAGIIHALLHFGKVPYKCSAAVIGNGNTARGAIRVLEKMGADVIVYNKKSVSFLREEIKKYDIIVNCVLWDVFRKDRLLYRNDLKKMQREAMIVDISCNHALEIETSHPTTFDNPVYYVDGILHYVVDHTASIFWKTATESISKEIKKYVDDLIEGNNNEVLRQATIIEDGRILDKNIIRFQKR